jgi:hypothetical protein
MVFAVMMGKEDGLLHRAPSVNKLMQMKEKSLE